MKISKAITLVLLGSAALLVQGCAHGRIEKRLDEKLAQESTVKSRKDLGAEALDLIAKAHNLSADQKDRLTKLQKSVRVQMDELTAQSLRLRSILIKDEIGPNYDPDEIDLIKKRLRTVEEKRLSVWFDAVEHANVILGRQLPRGERQNLDLFEYYQGGFN